MISLAATGMNIKAERVRLGMTQQDLAEKIGASVASVATWENGKAAMSITSISALADLFDVSVDELIARE